MNVNQEKIQPANINTLIEYSFQDEVMYLLHHVDTRIDANLDKSIATMYFDDVPLNQSDCNGDTGATALLANVMQRKLCME